MISLWHAHIIAETRQMELEQKARIHQLLKEAQSDRLTLANTLLVWVGGQMINIGERLQKPSWQSQSPICEQLEIPTCC